jgi:hypothetical protein
MSVIEQVQYETSVRKRYAAITFAAAVLIVISQLIQLSGPKADVNELTLSLVVASLRGARDVIAAVMEGVGYIALGFTLVWLHLIARARNPEMRPFVRYLTMAGVALASIMAIVSTIIISAKAHQFVNHGTQTYPQANALTSGAVLPAMQLLAELGSLLLAVAFVLTSLNLMRVGLLNRMLGYTGVLAGALILFPVGGIAPVIQGLWLAAIAVLLFGRWPSGDFPAWGSGLSVPWQPMQQTSGDARVRREARPRQQRRRTRLSDLPAIAEPAPNASDERPTPQKRKRKRRN